jgi:hypothetical protein
MNPNRLFWADCRLLGSVVTENQTLQALQPPGLSSPVASLLNCLRSEDNYDTAFKTRAPVHAHRVVILGTGDGSTGRVPRSAPPLLI